MKHLAAVAGLLAVLSLCATPVLGAIRTWPSAGCPSTLQACVDGAVAGDEVRVETVTPILENLTIAKSLNLHGTGYAAELGPGNTLTVNALSDGIDIKVGNFWLSGALRVNIGSPNAAHTQNVELRSLWVRPLAGTANPVQFLVSPGTQSSYTATLAQSRVFESANPGSATSVAVRFEHTIPGGQPTFNLLDNQIMSYYDGVHISLYAGTGSALVRSNRIGRYRGEKSLATDVIGLQLLSGVSALPAAQFRVQRNQIFRFNTAIRVWALGHLDSYIVNNTLAWIRSDGVRLERSAGFTLGGRIANNIYTQIGACALNYSGSAPTASADYNLYRNNFSNQCGGATAGANDRNGDPRFVGAFDFRLDLSSAAKDAGNNADQPQVPIIVPVPTPDYDQRAGRVDGIVDIGAHEFSFDTSFVHLSTPSNTSGNLTTVTPPPAGLLASDLLQLSSYHNGLLKGMPAGAEAHLGTWWNGAQWTIFRESGVLTSMPIDRQFFVLLNLDANSNLLHTAQAGNSSGNTTTLDDPTLNSNVTALPIVTQRFNPNSIYNNSSIGVWFDGTRWRIFNQLPSAGGAPAMPLNAAFAVMIPNPLFAPNNTAFRSEPLITAYRAVSLDHPLLNETPCAHPFVTAVYNPNNVYVPSNLMAVGGWGGNNYERFSWAIQRGDGEQIPVGAAFHVYVDPQQSRRCMEDLLHTSDFE